MLKLYSPIILALLAVSSAAVMIKWCDAPPLTIAAYRILIASMVLVFWNLITGNKFWKGVAAKDLLISMLSGVFLAIHFGAWITSLKMTSVTNSTVLVATSPFWVALASRFIFKKEIKNMLIFAFLIAFVGILCMTFINSAESSAPNSSFGDFLALVGAWGAGGYIICGRFVRKRVETLSYITFVYSFCGILLLSVVIFLDEQFRGFSNETYALLLLIALIPQLIGHSTFNWALKYLSAPLVSTLLLGEPVFASILAFFVLHESPGFAQIIGGILVVVGVAGAIWSEK